MIRGLHFRAKLDTPNALVMLIDRQSHVKAALP